MVIIKSLQGEVKVINRGTPRIDLIIGLKGVEVSQEVADFLTMNPNFVVVGKISKAKDDSYREELIAIKGVGPKTADDIIKVYPDRIQLLTALTEGKELPFQDDVEKMIKERYIPKTTSFEGG